MSLSLSDAAAAKILQLLEEEKNPALFLRLSVSGGGCSGFQYHFSLDEEMGVDDRVFEKGTARLVVDSISLGLLEGGVVDYQEDLSAAMFVVKNPNASGSCGCGNSFSL